MKINLITNSRSAQPGSTYSFFALFFPCLQVISGQPAFFALGGTPFLHKDTLGSFVFCLAYDLLCFLFVFCLAPVKEREGGPEPSLKTLCDLLSPAPCLSLPRVEICRDRHDQWLCKICASCVHIYPENNAISRPIFVELQDLHTPSVILH